MAKIKSVFFAQESDLRLVRQSVKRSGSHKAGYARRRFLERTVSSNVRQLSLQEKRERTEALIAKRLPAECGVYMLTAPSGEFYIGMSTNMQIRQRRHIAGALFRQDAQSNRRKSDAILRYGKDIEWSVLSYCMDGDEAVRIERMLLNRYRSFNECMNIAAGNYCQGVPPRNNLKRCYVVNKYTGGLTRFDCKLDAYKFYSNNKSGKSLYNQSVALIYHPDQADQVLQAQLTADVELAAKRVQSEIERARKKVRKYCTQYEFVEPNGRQTIVAGVELMQWLRSTLPAGTKYRNFRDPNKWYVKADGTESKSVLCIHPTRGRLYFDSIGQCAKYLKRSRACVTKALKGEQRSVADCVVQFV